MKKKSFPPQQQEQPGVRAKMDPKPRTQGTQYLPAGKLKEGSAIIDTTVTAYAGHLSLLDYSATKGSIVAFTRSLSLQLAERGVRVNAVAPGPIWTPLIPATFDEGHVESFGANTPMSGPGSRTRSRLATFSSPLRTRPT